MNSSRRLFWTGMSVLALGVVGCGDNGSNKKDGGDAGRIDGAAGGTGTDASRMDGAADGAADGVADGAGADAVDSAADGVTPDGQSVDARDGGGADGAVAPGVPMDLSASVFDRRKTSIRVTWTAPADSSGGRVAGYQVRYAKVAITAANFDTATVTTAAPYTGTPTNPGQLDGLTISGLYVENGYYFAVLATDAAGNRSPIAATTTATTAHFNVTQIPSTSGTNERFGFSVSGDGDLNGDGLSDILVGTSQGSKAYMFFGSQTFTATAPSVTFSGASAGYGFSVAQIGDVDHDGLPDVAISDASTGEKVFIYKGRRSWPMTLTDAQADYVISTDATYASSFFGYSIARLGDFTGDGVDDFAIGVRGYNTSVGRVVIIPGKSTGFASVALPDATNSIIIDGDATLGSSFLGYKVLGLGHFYSISSGTTLVASAPSGANGTPASAGHVYAFHGQTGTAGSIPLASADSVITGMMAGTKIGIVLTDLGKMLSTAPGVGIGNTQDTVDVTGATGTGYLTFGASATGPFASTRVVYMAGAMAGGGIMIGGGLRGQDVGLSLIGDATPDLVFGGQTGAQFLTISDGARIGAKTSPIELAATAEVQVPLPTGWGSGEAAGSMVSDVNGDGAPDFCIGSLTNPGAVLVYW